MGKFEIVSEPRVSITFDPEEMKTLYVLVANGDSAKTWESMRGYGWEPDVDKDVPYVLYEVVRDAMRASKLL